MRLLVVRAGALGDTILTLPAVAALRARYPGARIEAAGYPGPWSLAGPLVDAVYPISQQRFAGLYAAEGSEELRAWLAEAERVLIWTVRPPVGLAGMNGITHHSPFPPPGVHAADWLLRTAGLPEGSDLPASWRDALWGGAQPDPELVFLHPGAGAEWKRWPAERFAQVIVALQQQGRRTALIEGPADQDVTAVVTAMVAAAGGGPLPVIRDLPLPALARTLAVGSLFIGNDSGTTHLAAALGVPTIALFGPTDPVNWAPRAARVLRHCHAGTVTQGQLRVCTEEGCMERISVEDVLAAVPS